MNTKRKFLHRTESNMSSTLAQTWATWLGVMLIF